MMARLGLILIMVLLLLQLQRLRMLFWKMFLLVLKLAVLSIIGILHRGMLLLVLDLLISVLHRALLSRVFLTGLQELMLFLRKMMTLTLVSLGLRWLVEMDLKDSGTITILNGNAKQVSVGSY